MSLYFECNLNGKQVKVEDTDKESARVKTFVGSRKTFATPAFVRGTKQEVSTFLLNNQDRSFTGRSASSVRRAAASPTRADTTASARCRPATTLSSCSASGSPWKTRFGALSEPG
jgi:hypothetical protein